MDLRNNKIRSLIGMGTSLIFIMIVSCSQPGNRVSNVSWTNDIKPVLDTQCVSCHNQGLPSGGIRLDNYTGVSGSLSMNTGETIVKPGDAANSLLYIVISTDDLTRRMPRNAAALSVDTQQLFYVWINEGAVQN